MAQQLRRLAALAEELGLVPSIYMATHYHLPLVFQGTQGPFLASLGTWNA